MSRYRMVAIDFDGTLLSPTGKVTPATREAVHACHDAGIRVCFATGRNITESQGVIEQVGLDAAMVLVGGAVVIEGGKVVSRRTLSPSLAREAAKLFESSGHAALALQDTLATGVDYIMSAHDPDPGTMKWISEYGLGHWVVKSLIDHDHKNTLRIGIVAGEPEVTRIAALAEEQFRGRAEIHHLHTPVYKVDILELFDAGVNKWVGIQSLARQWGIANGEIVAIGDDNNDVMMLREAGLGIAMGNARGGARSAANRIIGSNAEDGLARFLTELSRGEVAA